MAIKTSHLNTQDYTKAGAYGRRGGRFEPVADRIALRSRRVGDCTEWTGSVNTSGYGHMSVGGAVRMVHRVVWTQERGDIPEGLLVLHTCDNPRCIKIEHLYLGTQADNKRDAIERKRVGRGWSARNGTASHCSHGHEWTPDNTYIWRGKRYCRACARERANRRYARRKLKY